MGLVQDAEYKIVPWWIGVDVLEFTGRNVEVLFNADIFYPCGMRPGVIILQPWIIKGAPTINKCCYKEDNEKYYYIL